jgi:thioredoxin reductase (NADPH)
MKLRDVLIVGAGPAGLATAIAATRAGLDYLVIEKGALVNSLQAYPADMVFFTTPELLEIGGLPFVSPYDKPTRAEALRYYRRVTDTFALDIAFDERVTSIVREDGLPDALGSLAVETASGRGVRRALHGRTVVVATGAYDLPNLLGVPGEDLPHVTHYYKEPHAFYRKRVLVVGGKNSAAEAALDLYRAGAHVTLVHRRAALGDSIKYWVKPDIENRIKEGAIAARFETRLVEIRPTTAVLERARGVGGERQEIEADAVFLMTGYRSDTALLERAGVAINPETCGPVFHPETFETSVSGLFVAGAAIAGVQSGKIFIENGRFHGQQVIDVIARRFPSRSS